MVVANTYEYSSTHSHTQLVLKAARAVHAELARSRNVACMTQVGVDDRVYRVVGRRHGSTDWAWEITAVERGGSESDVELVHEECVV